MWDIAEPWGRLRLSILLATSGILFVLLLAFVGVGQVTWHDGANLVFDFFSRPEPLLFLWGWPVLLLFLIFTLLSHTLRLPSKRGRRVALAVIAAAALGGIGINVRAASDPLTFFNGLLLFALPLLLAILLLIYGVCWIGARLGSEGGGLPRKPSA